MKSDIKVAFLTSKNPRDKKSWSGTLFRMLNSLENEFSSIIVLGPVPKRSLKIIFYALNLIHLVLYNKRYNKSHNILLSRFFAYKFERKLINKKIDVIFAPAAATEIAYLKTKIPVCYLADSSFDQLKDYYETYSNLSNRSLKSSGLIEMNALKKATTLVYPSTWASDFVTDSYKINKNKIYIAKFGANIDNIPEEADIKRKTPFNTFKLIFAGVEWERKGGPIVFEALKILLQDGYDITLTVIGCVPPVTHPKMEVIPFLNKNIKTDFEKFNSIFLNSHLLFVPSRAEAYGIVFCEANAFGLPVLTTDTGGIPSIVENGVNGYVLPYSSSIKDYADKIQFILENPDLYDHMCVMSRKKFEQELNWDIWGQKMKKILLLTSGHIKK